MWTDRHSPQMTCGTDDTTIRITFTLLMFLRRDASTYHDQDEGDHDPGQQLVGDGVLSERIPDGLVVAEEAPLEGIVLRGEDEERKPDCSEGEGGRRWITTLIEQMCDD